MEYNFFEIIGGLIQQCRNTYSRHYTAICPQDKYGSYVARLQPPLRIPVIAAMALACGYLLFWIIRGLLGVPMWPAGFFVLLSVAVLIAGGFLLRVKYTLTETHLIIRRIRSRRIPLDDLHVWATIHPPEILPGGKIRIRADSDDTVTLDMLRWTAGAIHFVMLLGERTGVPMIEDYLATENLSLSNSAK